jgi:methionyl-tRNA formyltransferase
MKITFLSDEGSWKNEAIGLLVKKLRKNRHKVTAIHRAEAVPRGDILFILGFFKIVPAQVLVRNRTNIVVHESALPKGRGWSPVHWLVIEGARSVSLTLFEAVEKVDAGRVYLRGRVALDGDELIPDLREKVGREMMRLCLEFARRYPGILKKGIPQKGKPTYYRRRTALDSRLNPNKSIARQFNLLRVVDNDHYPAFFTHKGSTYILKIEKKKG